MTPTQRQARIDHLEANVWTPADPSLRQARHDVIVELVDGPLASVIDLLDRMADYDADVDDEAEDVFDVFRRLDSIWGVA